MGRGCLTCGTRTPNAAPSQTASDAVAIFDGGLSAIVKRALSYAIGFISKNLGFNSWASKQGDAVRLQRAYPRAARHSPTPNPLPLPPSLAPGS